MKPIAFHNPQELSIPPNLINLRFLTVEEFSVLSDVEAVETQTFQNLFRALLPFYIWDDRKCCFVEFACLNTKPFHESLTVATKAALPGSTEPDPLAGLAPFDPMTVCGFITGFDHIAAFTHSLMRRQGFWDDREAIELACMQVGGVKLATAARFAVDCQAIALITTEESEWVEGLRDGNPPDDKIPEFTAAEAEAADVIIRIMDIAAGRGMRVAQALAAKVVMNASRKPKHGRNF